MPPATVSATVTGSAARMTVLGLCVSVGILGLQAPTRWPLDDTNGFRLPLTETTAIKRWRENNSKRQYE